MLNNYDLGPENRLTGNKEPLATFCKFREAFRNYLAPAFVVAKLARVSFHRC